ncbi:MAG: hypothetical protein JXC32_11500 [Anaerolineae bacterium]|nr:hypothetical protein [Anaerolineae bacterium]
MQRAETLIRTKLRRPYIRPGLVARPRLQARMAQGLRGPLTLIIAPAGYGKTTLVASSVAVCGMPVAWLSLEKSDDRAGRFLSYLVAALQEADNAIGSEAAQLLVAAPQAPPQAALTSLINDLDATDGELVLVLDDYQFISNQDVHAAGAFLLEHCPRGLHLVIATRSDPALPLARLRARRQMVELRAADLSFTEAEAAEFLNEVMGLDLDPDAIAVIEARTEGWIAGLQMAALSMRDRQDIATFVAGFSGTNRYILDYLLEEVLAREPEEVRAFLLRTAFLNRLTGSLCDAVTGATGGQGMLERLERRSLFVVPLDDERRWYRYHHLFADLLHARLHQLGSDLVARLASRAAAWCEREGDYAAAVDYAFVARDYEQAGRLVATHWWQVARDGEIEAVWPWMKALPDAVIRRSAPLSVAYGWVLWLTGQISAIEPHLVDAEKALGASGRPEGLGVGTATDASLSAELAALWAFVARYQGDFGSATAHAERALSLLPDDAPLEISAQLRAIILLALATAYDGGGDLEKAVDAYAEAIRWSRVVGSATGIGVTYRLAGLLRVLGRLQEADAVCRDALSYVAAQGMARLPAAGILHIALSEVLVERNELRAAEAHLAQGFELGKWSGRLDAVRNAAPALSRLRLAQDDVTGALASVEEAASALGEPPSPLAHAELLALKARILAQQGALGEATRCIAEARNLAGRDRGQTGEMVALAASRVQLAQREPAQSLPRLTSALNGAKTRGRSGVAIELHILRSLAYARSGDAPSAKADLARALALAEPEGYVRIFLDEGQPMQRLLTQWLATAEAGPPQGYASHLLSQFIAESPVTSPARQESSPSRGPDEPEALLEPLSQRELEVLQLIALGKTNRGIAQQLFIAPGTVKAHTSHIYQKLNVANRTEAVARARQLGILS